MFTCAFYKLCKASSSSPIIDIYDALQPLKLVQCFSRHRPVGTVAIVSLKHCSSVPHKTSPSLHQDLDFFSAHFLTDFHTIVSVDPQMLVVDLMMVI